MLVVAKTVGKKFKKQAVVPLETCIVVDNYSNGTSELRMWKPHNCSNLYINTNFSYDYY